MCCSIVGPLNAIRELVAIYKVKRRHESCTLRPASLRAGSAPGAAGAAGAARAGGAGSERSPDGRCRQRLPAPTGSARPAPLLLAGEGRFYPRGFVGGFGGWLSDVLDAGLVLSLERLL